jgi:hypothetical protein
MREGVEKPCHSRGPAEDEAPGLQSDEVDRGNSFGIAEEAVGVECIVSPEMSGVGGGGVDVCDALLGRPGGGPSSSSLISPSSRICTSSVIDLDEGSGFCGGTAGRAGSVGAVDSSCP